AVLTPSGSSPCEASAMFSELSKVLPNGLGLRFALWFALLFTLCSAICLSIVYLVVAKSMRDSDRVLIQKKLEEIRPLASQTDMTDLENFIRASSTGDESEMFVRVVNPAGDVLYIDLNFDDLEEFTKIADPATFPPDINSQWAEVLSDEQDEFLELYSVRLASGNWLEVGHSSEDRETILYSFRSQLSWVSISLMLGGLSGGF